MSEQSEQMLLLLQELAMLSDEDEKGSGDPAARLNRRNEIKQEMKRLAEEKKSKAA